MIINESVEEETLITIDKWPISQENSDNRSAIPVNLDILVVDFTDNYERNNDLEMRQNLALVL